MWGRLVEQMVNKSGSMLVNRVEIRGGIIIDVMVEKDTKIRNILWGRLDRQGRGWVSRQHHGRREMGVVGGRWSQWRWE